jgi:4-diphosphocytidyl-2-C-methyl-D-erythritol kinase
LSAPAETPGQDPVPWTGHAWAKVNLYLHILGRRPDGYHEIDSLIVFAGVGDGLAIAPGEGLSLEIDGPFAGAVPAGEDNLVLRAARALAEASGVAAGARITLHKALPAAAGLGGGSADAAVALRGLSALWGVTPKAGALQRIALALGADVPVCLFGRPAFVGGVGEAIERAPPLPPAWLVLVNPGVPLRTAEVFAAREGTFSAPGRWSAALPDARALAEMLADLENDLEPAARGLAPAVEAVLARLAEAEGALLARLSGSGATCFALFAAAGQAEAVAAAIAAERADWWVTAAPILHGPLSGPWDD